MSSHEPEHDIISYISTTAAHAANTAEIDYRNLFDFLVFPVSICISSPLVSRSHGAATEFRCNIASTSSAHGWLQALRPRARSWLGFLCQLSPNRDDPDYGLSLAPGCGRESMATILLPTPLPCVRPSVSIQIDHLNGSSGIQSLCTDAYGYWLLRSLPVLPYVRWSASNAAMELRLSSASYKYSATSSKIQQARAGTETCT